MADVGVIRFRTLAVALMAVLLTACNQTSSETGETPLTVASSTSTSTTAAGETVYLGIVRGPEGGIADPLGDLRRIQEAAPVPVPPVVSAVVEVACYDELWRYLPEGLDPAWVWVVVGPDSDLVAQALDLAGAQNEPIIETIDLCAGQSSSGASTGSTTIPDSEQTVLQGAGPSRLDQLGYQLGNALHGVDRRHVLGWGETSLDVEEATFLYDNVDGRSYEVWILFNPPDRRSLVFQFETDSLDLIEIAPSEVGAITMYGAKPDSKSVLAGQATVLVCQDRVQLRVESFVSPEDARDELIAITALVDCAAAFD